MIVKEKLEDGRIKQYSNKGWYLYDSRLDEYYNFVVFPFEREYEEVEKIPEDYLKRLLETSISVK